MAHTDVLTMERVGGCVVRTANIMIRKFWIPRMIVTAGYAAAGRGWSADSALAVMKDRSFPPHLSSNRMGHAKNFTAEKWRAAFALSSPKDPASPRDLNVSY